MPSHIPTLFLAAAASFVSAAPRSHNTNRHLDVTTSQFASTTTFAFTGTTLPTGLSIDTGVVATTPLAHDFEASNVAVSDGFLVLTVPGGQEGQSTISSAEVATEFDVLYASVRTSAILTEVAGVCNGMFLYRSDSQESDIEWLSDPASTSNTIANNGTRAMQYTNQALDGDTGDATSLFGAAPVDATSVVHEYRLDWTADSTMFYIDDVLQQTMTTNVPTEAGPWVWNNWVDGDPNWTVGPPATTAEFKIQSIVMYYNPA